VRGTPLRLRGGDQVLRRLAKAGEGLVRLLLELLGRRRLTGGLAVGLPSQGGLLADLGRDDRVDVRARIRTLGVGESALPVARCDGPSSARL
jgi:hypothetical protein